MEDIFLPVSFRAFRHLIKKRNTLHLQGTKAENITEWHLISVDFSHRTHWN